MEDAIWIKRGRRLTAIKPTTLQYIEGYKDGCTLHFSPNANCYHGMIIKTQNRISFFEKTLEKFGFIRCHRNYLINPSLIKYFYKQNSIIQIGKAIIPIAKRRKERIIRLIESINSNTYEN